MIREIRPEDCAAVAGFWRDCLDVPAATDESVRGTLDRMRSDDRYFTYVAEEDGRVVGFITCVEVLSFDDPDGYVKINGLAVEPDDAIVFDPIRGEQRLGAYERICELRVFRPTGGKRAF